MLWVTVMVTCLLDIWVSCHLVWSGRIKQIKLQVVALRCFLMRQKYQSWNDESGAATNEHMKGAEMIHSLIHYYTLGFNTADEDNGMFISLPQWMNTKDETWNRYFINMQILRSLECGEHSCASLWCLMSLPLWLESLWWRENRWTSLHSDWLQTRPNKPSGTPEQEAEGCPRRNLELECGGKTSHKLVPRSRSWGSNPIRERTRKWRQPELWIMIVGGNGVWFEPQGSVWRAHTPVM